MQHTFDRQANREAFDKKAQPSGAEWCRVVRLAERWARVGLRKDAHVKRSSLSARRAGLWHGAQRGMPDRKYSNEKKNAERCPAQGHANVIFILLATQQRQLLKRATFCFWPCMCLILMKLTRVMATTPPKKGCCCCCSC